MTTPPQMTLQSTHTKKNILPWLLGGLAITVLLICGISVVVTTSIILPSLMRSGKAPVHGSKVVFQAQTSSRKPPTPEIMRQTINILSARSKAYGFTAYDFQTSGADQIIARLPKNNQLDKLIQNLTQPGLIEFVDMGDTSMEEGSEIKTDFSPYAHTQVAGKTWHTILTGAQVQKSGVTTNTEGKYLISIELDARGTSILYEHSKKNTGKYLAITLDKKIISVPMINSPIPDGKAIIEGNFSKDSANNLALLLRIQPLPIEIKMIDASDY